jgi:hypothetical protein
MINEADTCRKYVLPKLYAAGWNDDQISEQKSFTDGRIIISEQSPPLWQSMDEKSLYMPHYLATYMPHYLATPGCQKTYIQCKVLRITAPVSPKP